MPADEQIISALKEVYDLGGWLAVLPIIVMMVVNFYKLPAIQALFPTRLQWVNLPFLMQISAVFMTAFGAALVAHVGKASFTGVWLTAVVTSFSSCVTFAGAAKPIARMPKVASAIARMPRPLVHGVSLVAPVDWHRVDIVRRFSK